MSRAWIIVRHAEQDQHVKSTLQDKGVPNALGPEHALPTLRMV